MMKIIFFAVLALSAVFAEEKIEAAAEGRGCGCNLPKPRSSSSSRSSIGYQCRQWSSSSSSSEHCCPQRECFNPPTESSDSECCRRCECTSSSDHCKPNRCRAQSYSSSYSSLPTASSNEPDVPICPCPVRDCSPCDPGFLIAPQQARNFEAPGHCACNACACDPCAGRGEPSCECRNPVRRHRKH